MDSVQQIADPTLYFMLRPQAQPNLSGSPTQQIPENLAISPFDMDSTTPSLSLGVKAKPRAWYCTADNAPSLLSKVVGLNGRTML